MIKISLCHQYFNGLGCWVLVVFDDNAGVLIDAMIWSGVWGGICWDLL